MPLTDVQIRNAKPIEGKTRKLSDGRGLQLWITPAGSKLWNVAYRYDGKQRKLSLGMYPSVGLKEAREQHEAARRLLAAGTDPHQQKRVDRIIKASNNAITFRLIANEMIEKKKREGKAESTVSKIAWLLDMAFQGFGERPVREITALEILDSLRTIEKRGLNETARRLRSVVGEVFRYAIATGRADNDPTFALKGALDKANVKHRAALTDPKEFGELLRAIDGYVGTPEVQIGLQLLALTFVRPGELRAARWSEFDLDNAVWSIPAERMKMRRPHKVPLSSAAVNRLKELLAMSRGSDLAFPTPSSIRRPISDNAFNSALKRMGFDGSQMTAHGFRAVASTLLNESGKWNADAIEAQLAHSDDDESRRAYHRAEYWEERIRMMNWWADKIEQLRDGGKVVGLQRAAG